MVIIVTGCYGFIGSKITAELLGTTHEVIGCGRNARLNARCFPELKFIYADFSEEISEAEWLLKLADIPYIDCIINCIGVLQADENEIRNIHFISPKQLISAALSKGLRKVVQVSALGIEKTDIAFARTKKDLDDYLLTLPIDVFIFRPSLVYGEGSYGGTSLFRGLAGLPGFIPLPGRGEEQFQPIHLADLSRAIVKVAQFNSGKQILTAVGPEQISLQRMLQSLRAWLGFGWALKISIPNRCIRWMVKIGDLFRTTISSTLFNMLLQQSIASEEETLYFQKSIGFIPSSFTENLARFPSYVQDRWHARLYFLKPLLRLSLAFLWLFSGLTSLLFYPVSQSILLLQEVGVRQPHLFLYAASALDLLLGLGALLNYKIKLVGSLQIIVILIYTLIITFWLPQLWLDPFGPMTKNLPIIVATAIMIALDSKR